MNNHDNKDIVIQNFNNNLNNRLEDHTQQPNLNTDTNSLDNNSQNPLIDNVEEPFTFKEPLTRLHFIRKVYIILTLQLIVLTLFSLIPLCSDKLREFFVYTWLLIFYFFISCIITLVILLKDKQKNARVVPMNYLLFFIFTIIEGLVFMYLGALMEPAFITILLFFFSTMFLTLSIYSLLSRKEFNIYHAFGFVFLITVIIGAIMCFTIGGKLWDIVINFFLCLGIEFLIIFHTKNIFIGQTMMPVGVDDYVVGALLLQLQIFGSFFGYGY